MSSKQEMNELLDVQIKEISDHTNICKNKDCTNSLAVLQAGISCIQDDLMEENREWTSNDINEWKTTLDKEGLCSQAIDIYLFVQDCLFRSTQFASKSSSTLQSNLIDSKYNYDKQSEKEDEEEGGDKENNKYKDNDYYDDDKLFEDEFKNNIISNQVEDQRRIDIMNQIKQLEESIKLKEQGLQEAEYELSIKDQEQQQKESNWSKFEQEKTEYLKAKSEAIEKVDDIFLEINTYEELITIREEIKENIQNYNQLNIIKIKENIKSKLANFSFINIDEVIVLLESIEQWTQKYPLCTDRNINLYLEIEKDNIYLNKIMANVQNTYNDQMLDELQGLHNILTELESLRIQNQNNNNQ